MKRIFSFLLALCTVLSALCFPTVAEAATLLGDGTEESPYLITCAADFATAKTLIESLATPGYKMEDGSVTTTVGDYFFAANTYFRLQPEQGTSITVPASTDALLLDRKVTVGEGIMAFSWTKARFAGVLDGNGVTVRMEGVTEDFPADTPLGLLFDYLGGGTCYDENGEATVYTAVVKNLTVDVGTVNNDITKAGQFGVIAGTVNGETNLTNVAVRAQITNTDTGSANHNVGGLIGKHSGGALKLEDCSFEGQITTTGTNATVGGLIGTSSADRPLTFTGDCSVHADLQGIAAAGGFLGSSSGKQVITVEKNATVRGSVTATADAGGFIGASDQPVTLLVSSAANHAAVSATAGGNAGGIVGNLSHIGSAEGTALTLTVQSCYNGGVISGGTNNGSVIGNVASEAAVLSVSGVILTASTDLEAVAASATAVTPTNVVKLAADDFQVLEGARIRLSRDDETQNGLRFDIAAKDAVDKLTAAGFTGLKMGSLMAKAENVTGKFTAEALDAAEQKYSKVDAAYTETFLNADGTYAAALRNFAPEQYSTKYACVGYITVTLGTAAVTVYTAYDSNNTRSVEEVAQGVLGDPNPGFDYSAYRTVLEAFAAGAPAAQE